MWVGAPDVRRAPTRGTNLNSVRVDGYVLKCPKKFVKRDTGQTFFGISSRFDLAHKSFKYVPRVGARAVEL
jgi:hypothetical protein